MQQVIPAEPNSHRPALQEASAGPDFLPEQISFPSCSSEPQESHTGKGRIRETSLRMQALKLGLEGGWVLRPKREGACLPIFPCQLGCCSQFCRTTDHLVQRGGPDRLPLSISTCSKALPQRPENQAPAARGPMATVPRIVLPLHGTQKFLQNYVSHFCGII